MKASFNISISELWKEYKAESLFFVVQAAVVALSTWLAQYIPENMFDNVITPVLNACTFTVAFTGAWILLRHSNGMRVRRYFAYALITWGVCDLAYLICWIIAPMQVMNMGAHELSDHELLLGNILGWVMLLYPTEALRPGWLTWKTAMWQLLPMCGLVALDYLVPVNLSVVIALYPYVLLALLFTHMRNYRIWCEDNYSTLDDIDVRWLIRYSIMLFWVGVNYVYMCYSHDHTRGFTQQWFVVFMMIYSVEQILFRKDPWKMNDQSFGIDKNVNTNNTKPNIEPVATDKAKEVLQWMQEAKPYLNPEFQLMDLWQVLPMNRTYLSHFIRDEFGCTFYQFVNKYRIEEAKRLMTEQPEMKMADIAAQSGFSSQSVFTQAFSKETGMSPREWSKNK